jgi:hypothetical protein
MYIDNLHHLRYAVRWKSMKNGKSTIGFSFTTMLQHTGRFWSRILAKNNVTTLEHPPYSPDLIPVDFYLFH